MTPNTFNHEIMRAPIGSISEEDFEFMWGSDVVQRILGKMGWNPDTEERIRESMDKTRLDKDAQAYGIPFAFILGEEIVRQTILDVQIQTDRDYTVVADGEVWETVPKRDEDTD